MSKSFMKTISNSTVINIMISFSILLAATSSANEFDLGLKIQCTGKITLLTSSDFSKIKRSKVHTKNSWSEISDFEGVSVKDLMTYAGCSGNTLNVHAINDYWAEIPMSDVNNFNILLADTINGKKLTLRDFGPYWIIYPVSDYPEELNKPIYGGRSIWQVDSITIK